MGHQRHPPLRQTHAPLRGGQSVPTARPDNRPVHGASHEGRGAGQSATEPPAGPVRHDRRAAGPASHAYRGAMRRRRRQATRASSARHQPLHHRLRRAHPHRASLYPRRFGRLSHLRTRPAPQPPPPPPQPQHPIPCLTLPPTPATTRPRLHPRVATTLCCLRATSTPCWSRSRTALRSRGSSAGGGTGRRGGGGGGSRGSSSSRGQGCEREWSGGVRVGRCMRRGWRCMRGCGRGFGMRLVGLRVGWRVLRGGVGCCWHGLMGLGRGRGGGR